MRFTIQYSICCVYSRLRSPRHVLDGRRTGRTGLNKTRRDGAQKYRGEKRGGEKNRGEVKGVSRAIGPRRTDCSQNSPHHFDRR